MCRHARSSGVRLPDDLNRSASRVLRGSRSSWEPGRPSGCAYRGLAPVDHLISYIHATGPCRTSGNRAGTSRRDPDHCYLQWPWVGFGTRLVARRCPSLRPFWFAAIESSVQIQVRCISLRRSANRLSAGILQEHACTKRDRMDTNHWSGRPRMFNVKMSTATGRVLTRMPMAGR